MDSRGPSLSTLTGECLSHVDLAENDILLTTKSGRQFRLYHAQECCESVHILSTEGDWHLLLGKKLVDVSHVEQPCEPEPADVEGLPNHDAYTVGTLTTITFRVTEATVISRWIGSSNGYYAIGVDTEEFLKELSTA